MGVKLIFRFLGVLALVFLRTNAKTSYTTAIKMCGAANPYVKTPVNFNNFGEKNANPVKVIPSFETSTRIKGAQSNRGKQSQTGIS